MKKNKIFIIGAGDAAQKLFGEINSHNLKYEVVAFVDDDKNKIGKKINDVKILGPIASLPDLVKKYEVEEIFIAIPSADSNLIRNILKISQKENVKYKIIPRTIDIIRGLVRFEQVREIRPQDLLGRPIVKHDLKIASRELKEKVVMVTGAAGSIGSEISKQMAILRPKKIICFDWWENGMFYLEEKLKDYGFSNIEYVIGNIQEKERLDEVIGKYRPDVIFHAAAYKHVPLMEKNINEAVKNNIIGTKNLAETAIKYKVKDFTLISTDKAINPSSVMGATKRVTEKLMYLYTSRNKTTRFIGVRFGNVLSSNGSVVPIFEDQIKKGGPLIITHPEMVRYFMSIEEAAQLVIQSWALGKNGEIFVLDMGDPIKIKELACSLIKAYGLIPDKDIEIKFTEPRPGEKLFEEISLDKEKIDKTLHSKIFVIKKEEEFDYEEFFENIKELEAKISEKGMDRSTTLRYLKKLVPNFKHD